MKKAIKHVNKFIDKFVYGTTISRIAYENESGKWTIGYKRGMKENTFYSFEDMALFLSSENQQ